MVQLTLGDFYKNHNVVINRCNVTVPEDASWETIPEDAKEAWYFGPNGAINWSNDGSQLNSTVNGGKGNSDGRVAQFPRVAEIQIEMNVMEKDRPSTGKAIWGDAPVRQITPETLAARQTNVAGAALVATQKLKADGVLTVEDYANKPNTFSANIRYDVNLVETKKQNTTATPTP
jgi:hypothetical protein